MKTSRAFAIALLASAICASAPAYAVSAPDPDVNPTPQDNSTPLTDEIMRLDVDMRGDYNHTTRDSHTYDPATGFEGRYLMLRVDGMIMPGLTYSWRQRSTRIRPISTARTGSISITHIAAGTSRRESRW